MRSKPHCSAKIACSRQSRKTLRSFSGVTSKTWASKIIENFTDAPCSPRTRSEIVRTWCLGKWSGGLRVGIGEGLDAGHDGVGEEVIAVFDELGGHVAEREGGEEVAGAEHVA